jgi:hypothetical protein
MSTLNDFHSRLRTNPGWVSAQFWATLLIVLAGVGWTRVSERHWWQVGLTLLLPLLMLAAALALEAGTMRGLLQKDERRARFAGGALTLLAWIAVVWLAWAILDWCNDQIPLWAGYLNSRASAHARARVFTYEHIQLWLTILVWIWRWIVVPAKVIPHAMASAQWGWRLPWRKLLRMMLNWRWWLGTVIAALVGVLLPSYFFNGQPHGAVAHQVWAVSLKLAGAYLLAITSWILLLAWAAVQLARQAEPAEDALDRQLLQRLYAGRGWIAGLAVWTLVTDSSDAWTAHVPGSLRPNWVDASFMLILLIAMVWLQAGLLRAMIGPCEKRVRMIWGTLMMLAWALLGLAAAILLSIYHAPDSLMALCWVLVPGLLIPFAAPAAEWGACLPWRGVLRVPGNWRWWAGVVGAAIFGVAVPALLLPTVTEDSNVGQGELFLLRKILACVLALASYVLLLAWYAVLLKRNDRDASAPDDGAMHVVPVGSGPLKEDSVKLPLPESGNDTDGNI